jgi:ribosomal protein S18 acetylase RimI-like enzyme
MLTIDTFRPPDLPIVTRFVETIQEHERVNVPDLKPATEIGSHYAQTLIRTVAERNGGIRLARTTLSTVGFVCAWPEVDDDPLLRDDVRTYAYVSDIFIENAWRRQGVALRLLDAIESEMLSRGCRRIRICSKAANHGALECYRKAGYRPYEITLTKQLKTESRISS